MPENSILSPVSLTSYFDNATGEARQANLFFYKSGTLDPIVVYTDAALTVPFPQPVATTGWGRVPPVYVGEIPSPGYRVRTFDQYQTLIEDLNGLPGALTASGSSGGGGGSGEPSGPVDTDDLTPTVQVALAKVGDIKLKWAASGFTEPGWVEITRGGTIGKPGSNATLLQHDDAHALFLHLWQQDSVDNRYTLCPVIPSKGASAQGDWDAGRQITVPDCRGRMLGGTDQYSGVWPNSATGRMDAGKFDNYQNEANTPLHPWTLGAHGGESVHQLTLNELAVHWHDWIDYYGHNHLVMDYGHTHGVNDSGHNHGTVTNDGQGGNYNVVGRTNVNDTYSMTSDTSGGFKQVALSTQTYPTGISIQSTPASDAAHPNRYMALVHTNYWAAAGTGGAGQAWTWTGALKPTSGSGIFPDGDNLWHQATETMPKPADYPHVGWRGDVPHNTLPPFILFTIYMKL